MTTRQSTWSDAASTALAPAVWGSTYFVASEFLPAGHPVGLSVLRALPAGLLLLLAVRRLPPVHRLGRIFVLGGLNFALFWSLLFVAAYALPGGVAATLGAAQALMVVFLSRLVLGTPVVVSAVIAAAAGMVGVAMLVLGPDAALDPVGVAAGIGGAASMAAGTVLSRKWRGAESPLTFTAWQLTAGGVLLAPAAIWLEAPMPDLSAANLAALTYLGAIGAALTYFLWFRGLARMAPAAVAALGFLSPLTAVILGWALLGQSLTLLQMAGAVIILAGIWTAQTAPNPSK